MNELRLNDKVKIIPNNLLSEEYAGPLGHISRVVFEPDETFKYGHYLVTLENGKVVSCGSDLISKV